MLGGVDGEMVYDDSPQELKDKFYNRGKTDDKLEVSATTITTINADGTTTTTVDHSTEHTYDYSTPEGVAEMNAAGWHGYDENGNEITGY